MLHQSLNKYIALLDSSKVQRLFYFLTLFLLCFSIFTPRHAFSGTFVGIDDFFAILLLPFIFVFFQNDKSGLIFLWAAIIVTGIMFGVINGYIYFDRLIVPSEMWQYVKRMVFFYFAFHISSKNKVTISQFCLLLIFTFTFSLIIGLLEINTKSSIAHFLSKYYTRTEGQFENIALKETSAIRIFGVAGNSIAWGGFSMFSAAVTFSQIIKPIPHFNKLNIKVALAILGLIAIINVIYSNSRSSIAALVFSQMILLLIGFFVSKHKYKYAITVLSFIILSSVFIYVFLQDRIESAAFRFFMLMGENGGINERGYRAKLSLKLISNAFSFIFGVGNKYLRTNVDYTEIESIYVFVNYGLLGLLLRIALLFQIFVAATGYIKKEINDISGLAIAIITSLCGYAVFTIGFYFFQELYVGLIPWLLFGFFYGKHQRNIEGSFEHA